MEILLEQRPVTVCLAADLIDSDGNVHCCMLPLSSWDIKISVVSQCRILVTVQYVNTQCFFFQLTTCTCWAAQWLPLSTQIDTDWTCLLTAYSLVRKHKHRFETDSDSSHTAHRLYILPTNSTLLAAANVSMKAEQLHPQQQSYDGTMCKKCYPLDFKKLPNQNSIEIQV